MARRMKTPAQAADRYQKGVAGAGAAYTAGVQNSGDWAQGALDAAARRNAGLQQAIADGTIDAGIQATGTAGWRARTLAKGPQAYTQSTATARPRYEQGMNRAMQYQQNAAAATASIDTSTAAGRDQKMLAWINSVRDQARAAKTGR